MKRFLELLDGAAFGLVQMLFVATALLLCCAFLALLARRSSAAVRHRIWSLGIAALLAYLFVAPFMPSLGSAWWIRHTEAVPLQVASAAAAPEGNESSLPATPESDSPKLLPASADPVPSLPMDFKPPGNEVVSQATELESTSPTFPTQEVASQSAWDWSLIGRIAAALWLFGMLVGLGAWLVNQIALRRLVCRSLPVQEASLLQLRDEIASALKISKAISVRCSSEVAVPQTTGIWRPIVLLPAGYGRWEAERLRVSLAHEMAHIARRDVLWQSLAQLANSLYWPHPLIWFASWRMRVEREHACDDAVLAVGTGPTEYAYHLVELASSLKNVTQPSSAAVAMAARSEVETRIRAILKPGLCRGPVRRSLGLALLLFAILATTAAGLLRPSFAGEDKAEAKTEVAAATEEKDERKPLEQKIQLSGTLVDEKGQPVPQMVVRVEYQFGQESMETTTNAEGRFAVEIPYRKFDLVKLITPIDLLQRIAYTKISLADNRDPIKNIRLQLEPGRSMEIHVVDVQGKPVMEAKSAVVIDESLCIRQTTKSDGKAKIWLPKQGAISQVYAWKPKLGLDYKDIDNVIRKTKNGLESLDLSRPITLSLTGATTISVLLLDRVDDTPIKNTLIFPWLLGKRGERSINLSLFSKEFASKTDDKGVAHFDWIPNWFDDSSTLEFLSINSEYTLERAIYHTYDPSRKVTMRLSKLVPIRGQVLHPDGKPIEGIQVVVRGVGYGLDGEFSGEARTDREGRYEIKAAPNQLYTVLVDDQKWASVVKEGLLLKPNQPKDHIDFTVRPATCIYGKITFSPSGEPVRGQMVSIYQKGICVQKHPELVLPEKHHGILQLGYTRWTRTDQDGRFQFFVGPGTFQIGGGELAEVESFEIRDQPSRETNFSIPKSLPFTATIVEGNPRRPIPQAKLRGHYVSPHDGFEATANAQGKIELERRPYPMILMAQSPDQSLVGFADLSSSEPSKKLYLDTAAKAKGRLIDGETKKPAANYTLFYGVSHFRESEFVDQYTFEERLTTDNQGYFEIKGLCIGNTYTLYGVKDYSQERQTRNVNKSITPERGNIDIQLGDVVLMPK